MEFSSEMEAVYKRLANEVLQWFGAIAIVAGHVLNAIGVEVYPWNIVAFTVGTFLFLIWCLRVRNRPQLVVNIVTLGIGIVGLVKAWAVL